MTMENASETAATGVPNLARPVLYLAATIFVAAAGLSLFGPIMVENVLESDSDMAILWFGLTLLAEQLWAWAIGFTVLAVAMLGLKLGRLSPAELVGTLAVFIVTTLWSLVAGLPIGIGIGVFGGLLVWGANRRTGVIQLGQIPN